MVEKKFNLTREILSELDIYYQKKYTITNKFLEERATSQKTHSLVKYFIKDILEYLICTLP